MLEEESVLTLSETATLEDVGLLARVILFNDEVHTFEEVTSQIIKATGCSLAQAEATTYAVHSLGKARVFEGAWNSCLGVSDVLQEIALQTQIEC